MNLFQIYTGSAPCVQSDNRFPAAIEVDIAVFQTRRRLHIGGIDPVRIGFQLTMPFQRYPFVLPVLLRHRV
ncbi:hypothetical protein D3C71_2006350 [compost metagenome]